MNNIRLGYGPLNKTLHTFRYKSMKLKSFENIGFNYAKNIAKYNCANLIKIMKWNYLNNIFLYRLPNNLIPHISNNKLYDINGLEAYRYQKLDWLEKELDEISKKIKLYNQRVTLHTPYYNHLASKNNKVVINTVENLYHSNKFLNSINCDRDSVIVMHIGGVYKNKEETMLRWTNNYSNYLCNNIKERLVIENCHNYSLENCIDINKTNNIPIVCDIFHHQIYNEGKKNNIEFFLKDVLLSWEKKDIRPKFHISEQGNGRKGKHSDYIKNIPDYLLKMENIDIMLEAKESEKSLFFLREKLKNKN